MRIPVVALAAGRALWTAPSAAAAEMIVCSKFPAPVYIAIGYQTLSDFKTRGWWEVRPGVCTTVDSRPVELPYYVHAQTKELQLADGSRIQHRWGKGKRLVVASGEFDYVKADQIGAKDVAEEFTRVSDGDDGRTTVTHTVVDAGNSETHKSR